MASSNKNWPSMFKSKPTNLTNQCHFSSNSPHTSGGEAERTPEPKPRWNPRPEQIRILEAIFNSGMVNPPREEIQKIRARLQEYGQVGDANVFYWFQNRKSRSKNKRRHLRVQTPATSGKSSLSSLSSSSTLMNSPTNSVNQPNLYQSESSFLHSSSSSQGFSYLSSCSVGNCSNVLVADHQLMLMNRGPLRKDHPHDQVVTEKLPPPQQIISPAHQPIAPHNLQDLGGRPPKKMTVSINDVCYEVATAPFNDREAFGDDAVLVHPSGLPLLTNQSALTNQPLQNAAFYDHLV